MVCLKPITGCHPSRDRGQGVVEAIVVLPAFLILFSTLFQLFLLAMGQVYLSYAVFCAARTGAVRNADLDQMTAAAGLILRAFPGNIRSGEDRLKLEILPPAPGDEDHISDKRIHRDHLEILQVRAHWDFPLIIPLAGRMISGAVGSRKPGRHPTLSLSSTWSMPLWTNEQDPENGGERHAL